MRSDPFVFPDLSSDPELDQLLYPSRAFGHPQAVVEDTDLSLNEKRAILASWASDVCASKPARDCGSLRARQRRSRSMTSWRPCAASTRNSRRQPEMPARRDTDGPSGAPGCRNGPACAAPSELRAAVRTDGATDSGVRTPPPATERRATARPASARNEAYGSIGSLRPGTSSSRPPGEWHALQPSALSLGATMWVIGHSYVVSTKPSLPE